MSIANLSAYVLSAMVSWVPVEEHASFERREITVQRYEAIAQTIAKVAADEPPVFDGDEDSARARTALLLASIASYESHYAARVEDCRVANAGALGLWQTVAPRSKVCSGREAAARLALGMVRQSFEQCKKHEELDRLAFYTDGFCKRDWGRSRFRVGRALRWWRASPPERASVPSEAEVAKVE
jgi:hypothetical protein